jgi:molecular chaperone DnaK
MIVGIDLGTTFSAIASVNAAGAPALFPDRIDPSRFHTPSVVHINPKGAFVGQIVEEMLSDDPNISICRFAKAGMGNPDPIYHCTQGAPWSAHAISSLILRKLKADAEISAQPITRCVISVPAHFSEAEKRATINAARLADLPVVGLVEEPVAAATFAIANSPAKEKTVLVFDLGGGTLDATILAGSPDGLYVLATEGAARLGGRDFDRVIMDLVLEQYRAQYGIAPEEAHPSIQTLRTFATRTKLELSHARATHINRPLMLMGRPVKVTMSRAQFDTSCAHLIEGCLDVCHRVLRSAALSWAQIDELVLVGGGSLLPCVEQAVIRDSGLSPERIRRSKPHEAVAFGVALLAEREFGNRHNIAPPLRQNVSSNQLGLRMLDATKRRPYFEVLVERNVPLPTATSREIYTSHPDQDHITIEVLQRKDEHTPPEMLECLRFGPLPQRGANYPIKITLGYDTAGRVNVSVCDGRTAQEIRKVLSTDVESDLATEHEMISATPITA